MTPARTILDFALKAAVSLLLVFLALLLGNQVAENANPKLKLSRFDDARGYQIFTSRCEVCHAKEEADLSRMGPNLGRIGVEAATRRDGLNGPEYILESIMDPGAFVPAGASGAMMPASLVADLPDEDVRNLVAHVASFGATPSDEEIAALVIREDDTVLQEKLVVRRDVLELGEQVFRRKCESCHSVHSGPEHVVYAPAIFGVGFPDEEVLRDSIKHVKGSTQERYASTSIALVNGEVFVGNVIERTPAHVTLLSTERESRGRVMTIQLSDVRKGADGKPELKKVGLPPGLSEIVDSLTPEEFEALVQLLKAFN